MICKHESHSEQLEKWKLSEVKIYNRARADKPA